MLKFITITALVFSATLSIRAVCPSPGAAPWTRSQKLPDPFLFSDGVTRVTSKEDWQCRRSEIEKMIQDIELGTLPPRPTILNATFTRSSISASGVLDIVAVEGGKTISFSATIDPPTGFTRGTYPAIIALQYLNFPRPADVGLITLNTDDIAAGQSGGTGDRGKGKFYNLYGSSHPAGAFIAWTWAVARVIDALEITTYKNHNVDFKRLGVSGCSRTGRGALVVGAFEPRIALTIPQESGWGGSGCWRLVDPPTGPSLPVEPSPLVFSIILSTQWYTKSFENFITRFEYLPYDHHMLAGLVAPRGLLVLENTDQQSLLPRSAFICSRIGRKIYEALGVSDHMGISQVGGGRSLCQWTERQQAELDAFVGKYLKAEKPITDVVKTDGSWAFFKESEYVDWLAPVLG